MSPKIVGIFDSGIGGVSIKKEIVRLLPKTKTIYLADRKNFPYAKKSSNELKEIALKNTKTLLKKGADLIVVACNTATAHSIGYLRKNFPNTPFVGVEPAVKPAGKISKKGIVVLSSPQTTESSSLQKLIKKYVGKVKIFNIGSLDLVNAVENNLGSDQINKALFKSLPKEILNQVDVLVLGCTHFPLTKNLIKKYVGKDIKVIDSGRAVARRVASLLKYN